MGGCKGVDMKRIRYRGIYRGYGYCKITLYAAHMCYSIWEGVFLISQNKR